MSTEKSGNLRMAVSKQCLEPLRPRRRVGGVTVLRYRFGASRLRLHHSSSQFRHERPPILEAGPFASMCDHDFPTSMDLPRGVRVTLDSFIASSNWMRPLRVRPIRNVERTWSAKPPWPPRLS